MNKLITAVMAFSVAASIGLGMPAIASAQSASALQTQINALLAQVQSLEQQLVATQGSTQWCYTFTANFGIGATGSDVLALNTALQKEGFDPGEIGPFSERMASAVSAFQEKYRSDILDPSGLAAGTGYVGANTRAKLNALYGCGSSGSLPTEPPVVTPPTSTGSASGNLNVTLNNSLVSGSVITGSASAKIGSYMINNPNSESVSVSNITIEGGQNASLFQNFKVMVGGAQFGITLPGIPSNGGVTFSGSLVIPANNSIIVDVYADVLSSGQPGTQNTTDLSNCTGVGESSNIPYSCNSTAGQTMVVVSYTPTASPSITLLSPNGGEMWQQGQTYQVAWQRTNFNDAVAINLIDYTPGSRYGVQYGITNGLSIVTQPGQNSFSWTIPASIPAGNYYKVVVGMGSTNSFSSNYFTINPAATPVQSQPFAPTISATTDPTSPAAGSLITGSVSNTLLAARFTAGNSEDVKLLAMNIADSITNDAGVHPLANLQIYLGATLVGSAGAATVSGNGAFYQVIFPTPVTIPAGSSITLTLKGDVPTSANGAAVAGAQHLFTVNARQAVGVSSGLSATITGQASTNEFTVVTYTPPTSSATPASPANQTSACTGNGQAILSWSPVAGSTYSVWYYDASVGLAATAGVCGNGITCANLLTNSTYQIPITAAHYYKWAVFAYNGQQYSSGLTWNSVACTM